MSFFQSLGKKSSLGSMIVALTFVPLFAITLSAKDLISLKPKSHLDRAKDPNRERNRTPKPGEFVSGSHLRADEKRGQEFRPIAEQKHPKGYNLAEPATKKASNDKESVWNQEYLNSDNAQAKRLKTQLERFERGQVGASVRDIDIVNKSADQIDTEAIANGFTKKTEPMRVNGTQGAYYTKDRKITADPSDPEVARQVFYEHADGGMIRVKPDGDPGNKARPEPQVSKSVRFTPSGTEWQNEAFKVSAEGIALPKSPNVDAIEISPRLKNNFSTEEKKDIADVIGKETHENLK